MTDILVPYYEIYINETRLSEEGLKRIIGITYEDTVVGSDTLVVSFQDPDFLLINDSKIVKSSTVRFIGGFVNKAVELFNGYISMIDVDFPTSGIPEITLTCMDKSYLMDRISRKEKYTNMRYDQIATKIAQRNNLSIKTQNSGKIQETVNQTDKTDIQFLQDIANDLEWVCYVKGNTLYFQKPDLSGTARQKFYYKESPFNLFSFSPRLVKADSKDGIDSHNIDEKTGTTQTGTADTSTPKEVIGKQENPKSTATYDPSSGLWRTNINDIPVSGLGG